MTQATSSRLFRGMKSIALRETVAPLLHQRAGLHGGAVLQQRLAVEEEAGEDDGAAAAQYRRRDAT